MDLFFAVVGVLASAFFSWLFTHLYYKKALAAQADEANAELKSLTELVEQGQAFAERQRQLLWQKRIQDCVLEHKRAGTPVGLIDTYADLSGSEKAELLDAAFMRIKGRKPKTNKYRDLKGAT
jgi:hypothetical protein